MTDKSAAEMLREVLGGMTERPWVADSRVGVDAIYQAPTQNCLSGIDYIACKDGKYVDGRWVTVPQASVDMRGIVTLVNCADELVALVEAASADYAHPKIGCPECDALSDALDALTAKLSQGDR